ncbi:MAG: alanine racemase [Candidatus Hatepunaea meridiana]|nr:alanine racemase [Candidatus Hatepunaea meridiana]
MSAVRPTRAEISISALKHNFTTVKRLAGSSKIMAVVKAEAYGHGLIRVAKEFAACGADYLGVSFLEEGIVLRKEGLDIPILVMGGLVDEQIESYLDYNLELTVSSVWKARHVEEIAAKRGVKAAVQLKVDTGMGRIGPQWSTAGKMLSEVAQLRHIEVKGLYTHLAASDSNDQSFTETQLDRFDEVIKTAYAVGLEPACIHAANSGAMIQLPDCSRYTMVRPGIILYGYPPSSNLESKLNLKPAMTLKTQVVYVKYPTEGTTIGYNSTWRSPGSRWIATLPVGYGDGYPRSLSNRGWVMLRGRKCPIVGRVSMDQITIDAGNEAYLGDEVILFGGEGNQQLSLWKLCEAIDAIPYELLCGLTGRVPSVYI